MSPYLLAVLAALAFALGSALQQRGTLETSAEEGDPRFLLQILRRPVWLLGGALQACGWVLQAAALDRGSLVVVQSLCTLSLVSALPLGVRLTGQHVGRRCAIGACTTLAGIVVFLAVGQPQGGTSQPDRARPPCSGRSPDRPRVAGMALLALLARKRRGAAAAALFATAAGISYGFQAAVTKVFMAQLGSGLGAILTSATTYALILSALVGFALQQSALKTGFLAPAMAAGNASTLITSVLLGVIVFQESISRDPGTLPVALLALAFAVLGVVLLASPDDRPPNQRIRQTATDT